MGKAKVGRPAVEIDWKLFEKLCAIQGTESEICSVLGVCANTLMKHARRHYGLELCEAIKKHAEGGRASLRRAQYKLAMEGNATMQIWLGKQHLKQRDPSRNAEIEAKGSDGSTVKVTFNVTGTDATLDV